MDLTSIPQSEHGLTATELQNLQKTFTTVNKDGSGQLNREEFIELAGMCYEVLDASDIAPTYEELVSAAAEFNFDGFIRGWVLLQDVEMKKVLGGRTKKPKHL
mmetsp:Transcript_5428/g.5941  ORF Transcript_5428/g.5941 Transcript_5428/m.5941 type:complete len:103 (-) Transcript_5428:208-516(-)